jgi:hypothetical protein
MVVESHAILFVQANFAQHSQGGGEQFKIMPQVRDDLLKGYRFGK